MNKIFFLILCLFSIKSLGQIKGRIDGQIVDSLKKKPISYATISVFKSADTSLITYRLSDERGKFSVLDLPLNVPCRLIISCVGSKILRREFSLTISDSHIDFGQISLGASDISLDEVLIKAERPPVIIHKDTIEFNASAFKTLPDALVEDLLKKLPGVNVDRNGNITVNGKRVSTIYVDGKDFFGGNIRLATRNLPSNIIEKVQVYNNQDAINKNPFINDDDIPQIINLKLKPNIKKGVFGKIYAGMGTQQRLETGAVLNLFRDTTQISLITYKNNLNKAGFGYEDLYSMGGFNRSGSDTYNETDNGGLIINDISFGGTGDGVQTSEGVGANFNTLAKKDVKINVQYFFGRMVTNLYQLDNINQSYNDTLLNIFKRTDQGLSSNNHNLGGRVQFKLKKFNIDYRPNFLYSYSTGIQNVITNSSSNFIADLNESENEQKNTFNSFGYSSSLFASRGFNKKGASLNIYNTFSVGGISIDQYNNVSDLFYPSTAPSILNQLRKNDNKYISEHTSIRYTEPISKKISYTVETTLDYFRNKTEIKTFNKDSSDNYSLVNSALSERYSRNGWKSSASGGLRWKNENWIINPSLVFQSLIIENDFSSYPSVNQRLYYFQPKLYLNYDIYSFSYSSYFTEPTASQLKPIIDNTNPLLIVLGNPNLNPTVTHNFSLRARKFDRKRFLTYNVFINANLETQSIVYSRDINNQGVQTIMPININGNRSIENRLSLQKDIKTNQNLQISVITSNYLKYSNYSFVLNSISSQSRIFQINPALELRLNLNDKLELNQLCSVSNSISKYASNQFTDLSTNSYSSKTEVIFRLPQHIVWETSLDYQKSSIESAGFNPEYYKWNAAITFVFLKNNRGLLKLSVNDILNQNTNNYRTIRENYIEDIQTNALRRYGLLTFTYNIRNFGGKVGGRNQLLKF